MNMQIFALDVHALSAQTARRLCPAADTAHAEAFCAYPDRGAVQTSLAANALLRYAASRVLGVPMRSVTTGSLPSGQPTLQGTGLFCSVSHTDGLCVCAVSDAPVGIDVEKLREAPLRVAKRVFSPQEQAQLASADDPDRAFFEIWTKRESVVKLTGEGMRGIRKAIPPQIGTGSFLLRGAYCVSVSAFTESS